LTVSAYGSYYRLRPDRQEDHPFAAVLASAVELGAPVIRVWAGNESPDAVEAPARRELAERARQIAVLAAAENIQITFEYHSRTLTETTGAALELMQAINHPNVHLFWQPRNGWLMEENRIGMQQVAQWVSNIHCFHWLPTSKDRLPLESGAANWRVYLDQIAALEGDRHVSIEFVQNGTPEQYLADAAVLNAWLRNEC
jgi:sugar phosphate isomerase/epimerase